MVEIIRINHGEHGENRPFPPLSIALGFFDGVHIGHRAVISAAVEEAERRKCKSAVMTFHPSPKEVLGNRPEEVRYITTVDEKMEEIGKLGVDYLFLVSFTREFAQVLPEQFVDEYLVALNAKHVVAGFDFTYGKFGKGTMESMKEHARGRFTQTTVEKIAIGGEKISSTTIRRMIEAGEVEQVPVFLGRHFTMEGTVVHGEKRGRTIGFPTANIDVWEKYVLPKTGVYLVRMYIHNRWVNGICNIGRRPTFQGDHRLTIEVHLLDFHETIYGERVKLEWLKRVRDEEKFPSVDALVAQMRRDLQTAVDYFSGKESG